MSAAAFFTALADENVELRLYVQIQGIPYLFHGEASFPTVLVPSGMAAKGLLTETPNPSESRLNLDTRRIEGAALSIKLQDDDAGTLAGLFRPRQFRSAFVTSSVTEAGDIDISNTASAGASGVAYIGGESVRYTSVVGNTLTGCTRGDFSSIAQAHPGGADDGEDVFFVPRSWMGRRVYLLAYLHQIDCSPNGEALAALTTSMQFATFLIKQSPRHLGDDLWSIDCGDLIEEFAAKKIGGGLRDVQLENVTSDPLSTSATVRVGAGANFNQFVTGIAQTYVRVTQPDAIDIGTLIAQSGGDSIEFGGTILARGHRNITELRHIGFPKGSAGIVALQVLASRLGDLSNGAYDWLPGYEPSNLGESGWRMGAGILESEIDVDSFLAFLSGDGWSYPIDDAITVADFMSEWCIFVGAAYLTSRAGQIKVIPLSEVTNAPVMTIGPSVVAEEPAAQMEYDESAIFPRLHAKTNYDPISKEYLAELNSIEGSIQRVYPNSEAEFEIETKGIWVDRDIVSSGVTDEERGFSRPAISEDAFLGKMRRVLLTNGRGRTYIHLPCHLVTLNVELGQVVYLNDIDVPDGENGPNATGVITLQSHPARLVGSRPRFDDSEADLTFELLDKMWHVAPACTIASRVGVTLTLNTADIGIPDNKPGRMFADTGVKIVDVSTGATHQANVVAHTDTTVDLDVAPAFANQANVDYIKLDSQTNGSGATSQNGFVDSDFIYMMPDDENDGTPVEITRWG